MMGWGFHGGGGVEGSTPQMYILCHIRKVPVCILYIFTVEIIHHYYAARIVGRNVKMFYQYNEKISVFLWFWEVFRCKKTTKPYILLMIYTYFYPLFFSSELQYFVVTFGKLSPLMVGSILVNIEMNDPVIGTKTRWTEMQNQKSKVEQHRTEH